MFSTFGRSAGPDRPDCSDFTSGVEPSAFGEAGVAALLLPVLSEAVVLVAVVDAAEELAGVVAGCGGVSAEGVACCMAVVDESTPAAEPAKGTVAVVSEDGAAPPSTAGFDATGAV